MKNKFGIFIRLSAVVLLMCASGCAAFMVNFRDRKRALVYLPPENFHAYSTSLAKELAYTERWVLPLADTVNIDVSSISYTPMDNGSLIVSFSQAPLGGKTRTHFLVKDVMAQKPHYARVDFEGDIVPIQGKLYAIESTKSGFSLSSCSDALALSDKKNITLTKFYRVDSNRLDSNSTGNYRVEDNISSYFVQYPYIVFYSINYKTDKYYKNTRYQSEDVQYNSVEFYVVDLETGKSVETPETDFTAYYKQHMAKTMGSVFVSLGSFNVVGDGKYFSFSLSDGDSYVNGYFENDPGKTNDIYMDSAKNIVARFPTLVIEKTAEKTKEEIVLQRAMSNDSTVSLADGDVKVLSFIAMPELGFLIFARQLARNSPVSTLYLTDPKLDKIIWKRDFNALSVRRPGFNTNPGFITLPDLDGSGMGIIVVRKIDTGYEAKLLPANLYESDHGVVTQYCVMGSGVLILYDDVRGALVMMTQQ
jgi:hypothetical protein